MYKAGTVLFSGYEVEDAKDYIKRFGLTREDVKILKYQTGITVEAIRSVTLGTTRD